MDAEAVNLKQLIEDNLRGRSWPKLAARLDGVRSPNTVRGWATGQYPLPEFQAAAIAEFLNVTEAEVLAAGAESRRLYESRRVDATFHTVGGSGKAPPIAKAGGRRKAVMRDERDEIVGALASIGQQLLDLAQRIDSADREPPE